MSKEKFDPNQPHGTCHGEGSSAAFYQNGRYFTNDHKHVPEMDDPNLVKKKKKKKKPEPEKEPETGGPMSIADWAKSESDGEKTGLAWTTVKKMAAEAYPGQDIPTRKEPLVQFVLDRQPATVAP
ncbi:MAG: hypothetical protein GY952_14170 [Rhodobacteraceae bacterium]|nr:hypothetical protein [Paracoccaceae bacterium]